MSKKSNRSLTAMPGSYPDIAKRFKQFKEDTGLTYKDLAEAIGTTVESLQAYASGRVSPNFYTIRMMKKKFGLSYDWLIDGTKASKKNKPLGDKLQQMKALLKEWESD